MLRAIRYNDENSGYRDCQRHCDADDACSAFTFRYNMTDAKPNCKLFGEAPICVPLLNRTSGIKGTRLAVMIYSNAVQIRVA